MKACMVLFDSELNDEVFMLMKLSSIVNYTQFKGLHGSGNQGRKQGSITWPGTNEMIFMIVDDNDLERFKDSVKKYKQDKGTQTGLIFFYWELKEVII